MVRRWSLALAVAGVLGWPVGLRAQSSESRIRQVGESSVRAGELNARTALIRGLAVPGLGQFYAGKPVIGAGYLGATTTAVLIGLMSERIEIECLSPLDGGECPVGMEFSHRERRHLLGRSLLAAGAIAAAGAVHAWLDVRRATGAAAVEATGGPAMGVGLVNAEWAGDRVRVGLVNVRF